MNTHRKTKIEIIAEAPVVAKLLALAADHGIQGSTVLPVRAGTGHRGDFSGAGLSSAMSAELVILVADEAVGRAFAEEVSGLLETYRMVMWMSEVHVFRNDYF